MDTEQKTFTDPMEFLQDLNRRVLELERDMQEMDVAFEVIYSVFFTLGVKPSLIPELADRIRARHQKVRGDLAKAKEKDVDNPA